MGHRENELVAWLRGRLAARGLPDLLGDDAAVLPAPPAGARWVLTVDSQIAGVHHPPDLDPALVGRRLLAVNLSDLAATGADPAYALLALSAPPGYDYRRLFEGLLSACAEYGVTLAGGDLARTEPAVATLTLTGWLPEGRARLSRAAAQPGHGLWVGGALGESAAGRSLLSAGATARWEAPVAQPPAEREKEAPPGVEKVPADFSAAKVPADSSTALEETAGKVPADFSAARGAVAVQVPADFSAALEEAARRAVRRHLAPAPQLALGRDLAKMGGVGAAMDLSDGLAVDLARMCRASGVGAEVEADLLPLAAGFAGLAERLGEDPLRLATEGGEDYVLLFSLPDDREPPPGPGCTRIGRFVEGEGAVLLESGRRRPLGEVGWDHLRSEPAPAPSRLTRRTPGGISATRATRSPT